MIKAEERYLLQQAGFTERQINTQMQKFYNLFRVAPMPQMKKEWVKLNDEEIEQAHRNVYRREASLIDCLFADELEAKLKEKNNG